MTLSLYIAVAAPALLVMVFLVGLLLELVMLGVEACTDATVKPAPLPKCTVVSE